MIYKIAVRYLKLRRHKTLADFFCIALALAAVSFLLCLGGSFKESCAAGRADNILSLGIFFVYIENSFAVMIALIALSAAVFIFNSFSMGLEEQLRMIGLLAAAGASGRQKRGVMALQSLIVFALAAPSGLLTGYLGGLIAVFLSGFLFDFSPLGISRLGFYPPYAALAALAALGGLVVAAASLYPMIRAGRVTTVDAIRSGNDEVCNRRHGWRGSGAFTRKSMPERIARLNFDYNIRRYRAAALSLALAMLTIVVCAVMFVYMGGMEVMLDPNPYGGDNTVAPALGVADALISALAGVALLVIAGGGMSAAGSVYFNIKSRRRELAAYRSVGMEDKQLKTAISAECRLLGGLALFWGGAMSLAASFVFYLLPAVGDAELYYPVIPILLAAGIVFVITRIISAFAVRYVCRINTADALKLE